MRKIGVLFFILPFILTALNIQAILAKFYSVAISQLVAYANIGLVLAGIFFFLNDQDREAFPFLGRLWLFFFAVYFGIGLWGNIIHANDLPLLKTLITPIYFIGFLYFLGIG